MDSIVLNLLTDPTLWIAFLVFCVAAYVYTAVCFGIIARKTNTPGGWMAWVPIANAVLICRIARRPGWWVLLLLVPVVNFVIGLILFAEVARARGKSPWLAVLLLVPIGNVIVPGVLAAGPAAGAAPPPPPVAPVSGPPACPACGSPECVGEEFCGYTGQRIAGMAAPPPPPMAAPQPAVPATAMGIKILAAVLVVGGIAYAGMGVFSTIKTAIFGGLAAEHPPMTAAAPPTPAQRAAAGTLTEFPVDTASDRAVPTSMQVRNLRAPQRTYLPAGSFPAGMSEARLARVGRTMTSVGYQAANAAAPIRVHVLETDSQGAPPAEALAQDVVDANPGAQMSGVRVQSPVGATYNGYRVRTPDNETYVFDKAGAAVTIVIFAPTSVDQAVANRLAANIGNGTGLLEEPLLGTPVPAPAGLQAVEQNTFTGAALTGSAAAFRESMAGSFGAQAQEWIERLRPVVPARITQTRYAASGGGEFHLLVGDYGQTAKAWSAWQLLRAAAGMGGMQSLTLTGAEALTAMEDGKQWIVFHRGSTLGIAAGPDRRAAELAEAAR